MCNLTLQSDISHRETCVTCVTCNVNLYCYMTTNKKIATTTLFPKQAAIIELGH